MLKWSTARKRQNKGMLIAVLILGVLLFVTKHASGEWLLAPGGMIAGHEKLSCAECHQKSPGSLRQQLQAKLLHLLDKRPETVAIGHQLVGNKECLACHIRSKDRHPIYRFLEPRYRKAREELAPQFCTSCHREHQHQRVNMGKNTCSICHGKIRLKRDPLDISHENLAKNKRWETCLGCHDFHGNHRLKPPEKLNERIESRKIVAYFENGISPYPLPKKHKARRTLKNDKK